MKVLWGMLHEPVRPLILYTPLFAYRYLVPLTRCLQNTAVVPL